MMEASSDTDNLARSRTLLLAEIERLFEELQSSAERTELIAEIDRAILRSTFSPKEVFDVIVEKCLLKTGCRHGQVVEYRRNRLVVTASSDPARVNQELPLTRSLCGLAIRERTLQHCPDVAKLPVGSYVRFHDDTASELVVLIKPEHTARILGVLDLERGVSGPFSSSATAFAELLARQAAIAVTHTRTWSGSKMLYEISTSLLSGKLALEESYQTILDSILDVFDFEHGQILRLIGDEFVILASSCKEDVGLRPGRRNSVCGRYLIEEQGRALLVLNNIQESPYREYYLGLLHAEGQPMCSEMIVPLIDNDRLVGALNIESTQTNMFSDLDKNLLGIVGGLMAAAISATFSRRRALSRTRTEAANVALTQLGHVAQSFLHRFGNSIGDSRARLLELMPLLPSGPLPGLNRGTIPVSDFLAAIVNRLSEAGNTLSQFSDRFNPKHPRFQLKEVDLEQVARVALDQARDRHVAQPVSFEFISRVPSAGGRAGEDVRCKPICLLSEEIFEIIENLLNNAVEAILEKGPDFSGGQVSMLVELQDPFHARLAIKDNGVGVAVSDQASLFEFGFTTKKNRQSRGGIGLWFCDLYLRQRGGEIRFESKLGEGSLFEVVLPTVLADAEI
jgi:signal transduction histidine kinase